MYGGKLMEIFWYISPVDGRFPWKEEGRYPVDHHRLRRLASTIDRAKFSGALLGTYAHDVFTLAASLFPLTERMRFLIPVYPGVTAPTLLAQQALTFDDYSGGRLILNLVNGSDSVLAQYGVHLQHDDRYEMSAEYWKLFKRLYAGETVVYQGKHFDLVGKGGRESSPTFLPLGPIQSPHIPLWGAGASPAGIQHAAEVVDTYLTFLQRPEKLSKQIEAAKEAAASQERTLRIGTLASVIVRETEEEALEHFLWLQQKTGADTIADRLNANLVNVNGIEGGLASLTNDNPQVQARIDALRAGHLPELSDLEFHPNLYAGTTPWSPLDVFDNGWGSYIVGSPIQVAERLRELKETLGIDVFILSGWPLIDEANYVSELLLPLLELDIAAPVLAKPAASAQSPVFA
ncbi:LLM class flavin-dependent oxidoreductase [Paenibacillus sp. N3.4]|uniref:LLM class flavin-dependent oxidoreductase n=1 Tax=Paenibacillus sp. N3.4 TaxID=2603222 RepID=UPI0011CC1A60|nr:LLM class flavin-dependent oxidoreductase [Paenibacillus sp. N3.4]TXK83877.1 LLM class flavin-dependent oxidoreductase [Paenibacillus sp. N3.4]